MAATYDRTMLETIYRSGGANLGHVVFWQAHATDLPHATVKSLVEQHGFGKFMRPAATFRNALRDAIEEWLEVQGKSRSTRVGGKATKSRIEVVNDWDDDLMCFIVVAQEADLAAFGLSHATELRVFLNKKKGDMFVTSTDRGNNVNQHYAEEVAIGRQIAALYDKHKVMLSNRDVSAIIGDIVDSMDTISLRPNGGVYFVPNRYRDEIDRLRALCADLTVAAVGSNGSMLLTAVAVADVEAERKQFASNAHHAFEAEIAALSNELGRMMAQKAGTVGAATVAKHIERFKALEAKAAGYTALLGMRQEAVAEAVERLTAQARTVVLRGTATTTDDTGTEAEADPFEDAE